MRPEDEAWDTKEVLVSVRVGRVFHPVTLVYAARRFMAESAAMKAAATPGEVK